MGGRLKSNSDAAVVRIPICAVFRSFSAWALRRGRGALRVLWSAPAGFS